MLVAINYFGESEKYRPEKVRTLLIGEAPPASRKTYFYVPKPMDDSIPIRADRSLPATIFNHYFGLRPATAEAYEKLLRRLQEELRIFLIDISDEPIRVRGNPDGVEYVKKQIPNLRIKIAERGIEVPDRNIIFLLARKDYSKEIRLQFPESERIPWIDFRLCRTECPCCLS